MPISLKPVYEQIEAIAKTSSTLGKVALLKTALKDDLFRLIVRLAYNQTYSYNVKSFPEYSQIGFCDRGWEFTLPILGTLVKQQGADNAIKQRLFQASSIDKETYEIVKRICEGDLKCGIGARLINKSVPNTVKILSYQRCATSKHIDHIKFEPEAMVQCKADGSFANMFVNAEGDIKFVSRSGQNIRCLQFLKSKIKSQPSHLQYGSRKGTEHDTSSRNKVFMGELRVFNEDGSIMPRKQGNGIINECIKGTVDPKVAKRIFYTTWNCVPVDEFYNGESTEVQRVRFFNVTSFATRLNSPKHFRVIEFEFITSLDEAYVFFRKMRAKGEEGAIVKNIDGIWEDDQSGSKDCIKLKHSFECDLKVVGWNPGKKGSKYEHTVGSIICESECGKLRVNVSGLTDEERDWDWDMMQGIIVTVEAESVITSKSKDTSSLYTPSFIEPREDKTIANTLEEIIEIAEESKKTRRRKA